MKKLIALILLLAVCFSCAAAAETGITIDNIRESVVGLDEPMELRDGTSRPIINFDNAATTPALQPVMDEVNEKLAKYGSIGRGFSVKSDYSTDLYLQYA